MSLFYDVKCCSGSNFKFPNSILRQIFWWYDCVWDCIFESCLKYMYLNLNGSNSVKVILVCVILGSAHKVSVFSSIELRISYKFWIATYSTVTMSQHMRL